MDRKTKKFHWSKAKIKKCVNGSISVLLCLLLTPFLSVTLALIEYARYQEIMEIADELMELTELFALADYDQYIHTRFGMLSVSQEGTLGDGLEAVLADNAKITGNQLIPSNVTVSGDLSLQNTNVLRQQLVDFSQLTSPTALVMEDLGLEELLEKLKGLEAFNNITDTVDKLADATEKVNDAAKAFKKLKEDLDGLKTAIDDAKDQAKDLVSKFTDLVKNLGDNGITLPAGATVEQIEAAVQDFMDHGYIDQIKDIYKGAKALKDSLEKIKNKANDIKTDAQKVKDSVKAAADAVRDIGKSSSEQGKSISSGMTKTVENVVNEMNSLVEGTLKEIRDDTVNAIKDAADEILKTVLERTGLSDVAGRYYEIIGGSYYNVSDGTLSDHAKQDIQDFIRMALEIYIANAGGEDVRKNISDYFEGRFVPDISFEFDGLLSEISGILEKAIIGAEENAKTKLTDLVEKLGNLARSILNFSLFSNPHLNRKVSLTNQAKSSAQKFLDALKRLLGAIEDFKNSIGSFNLIGALTAVWDLLGAIKDMFAAIFDSVKEFIDGIKDIFNGIYDRVIISGYMAHSLPCRTDATATITGGVVQLKGDAKSLTGYAYNDIPRDGGNTFMGAELEYVYKGSDSETTNQVLTFLDLYFLRLLIDLPSIFADAEVAGLAAAATVASWVVYIVYVLVEPFLDTILLVNGAEVPLIKTKCWLTPTGLVPFAERFMKAVSECEDLQKAAMNEVKNFSDELGKSFSPDMKSGDGGGSVGTLDMSYKNYVLVMMMIRVETNLQVQRLGNLMDLEATRYYQKKGKTFDMAQTYTALNLSADMKFNPFVDMGILAGDGPLNLSGHMTRTVSY